MSDKKTSKGKNSLVSRRQVLTGGGVAIASGALAALAGPGILAAGTASKEHKVKTNKGNNNVSPKQAESMKTSGMLAGVHAGNGVEKCSACHGEEKLKEDHAKVVPGHPIFVKARKFPKDFCLECHGTVEALANRTAESKALTDMNGRVVNPHDVPKNSKHYKTDECYTCHRVHKKSRI